VCALAVDAKQWLTVASGARIWSPSLQALGQACVAEKAASRYCRPVAQCLPTADTPAGVSVCTLDASIACHVGRRRLRDMRRQKYP